MAYSTTKKKKRRFLEVFQVLFLETSLTRSSSDKMGRPNQNRSRMRTRPFKQKPKMRLFETRTWAFCLRPRR